MATTDFQQQMNQIVQRFMEDVAALARREAVAALASMFGDRGGRNPRGASWAPAGGPRGARGGKRTPAELDALAERFITFVRGNPGLRIEQINRQIGTQTRDLALPIRKLIADGVIRAEGHKRSTTYVVADHGHHA
jgi:hypothetical protein